MRARLRGDDFVKEDFAVPSYAARTSWPQQVSDINAYAGVQPLPARCRQRTLPPGEPKSFSPNGAQTGECFQLDLRSDNQTQPVLPTLFVPGFPKAATTWLFECMHAAFAPEMICPPQREGDFSEHKWSIDGCGGRRFMLPGIACHVLGGCGQRKELFFYGGGYGDYFKAGLAALHGPEVPLELFQTRSRPPPGWSSRLWEAHKLKRMEYFCTSSNYTHLPDGRMHPSCCVTKASAPNRWGCRWHESLRKTHGKTESVWFQMAMPWATPGKFSFASVDFTPNYLCTPSALQNIYDTARDPGELRFIVLMRDPIMRAFSEWSMFTLGWRWDKNLDFMKSMRMQMARFRKCNSTLFHNNERIRKLPTPELFAYMSKCMKGNAMQYITNSIYPVCVEAALRVFKREQFLFLRFEDLMQMKAPGLVTLLANFTGLYTDDDIIRKVRGGAHCEAGRAKKVPLSFGKAKEAAGARKLLEENIAEFESFFKPYDQLLMELVHPAFAWNRSTHSHSHSHKQ